MRNVGTLVINYNIQGIKNIFDGAERITTKTG